MKPQSLFSPTELRYVAALRGNTPRKTGSDFVYGEAACADPDRLICLAASNPEGRFFAFVDHETARRLAEDKAAQRGVYNAIFLTGSPSEILARLGNGSALPPPLDYLCCDNLGALPPGEREALFDLAQSRLNPGGLFAVAYDAYDSDNGALHFLVRELAPEMNAEQKQEFLAELKRLGTTYLSRHPEIAARLDDAIVKGDPDAFLSGYVASEARSGTFDVMVALRERGMIYGGDAHIRNNYVEMAVPGAAQSTVVGCRDHILYEPIKDLALDRTARADIWVKAPALRATDPAQLLGGFAFGLTVPRESVPEVFQAQGSRISLSSPLYSCLLDLLALMPIGVGDALSHPSCAGEDGAKILEALQTLVACGLAAPMRGLRPVSNTGSVAQPRLIGSFNRFLDKTDLDGGDVVLASPVMGCGVAVSAREALVMQALNRAGLSNSVSALMPELRRLAESGKTGDLLPGEPTAELAQGMVRDVVGHSLPQWYALALLGAA